MKKVFSILIAFAMVLSIAGCGGKEQPQQDKNPLMNLEIQEAEVLSGGGELIGKRAYVEMPKSDYDALTDEQLVEFAESVVDGADYNWFTVILDDGTGLEFPGCSVLVGMYGSIDGEGVIEATEQYVSVADGNITFEEPN